MFLDFGMVTVYYDEAQIFDMQGCKLMTLFHVFGFWHGHGLL